MFLATSKADQNLAAVDPWTAVHAGTGLALGLLGVSLWKAMAGAIVYEVIEAQTESTAAGRRFFSVSAPENFQNQIVDLVVFGIGVQLGLKWNGTG